jgi:hypothetical protein
MAKYDLPNIPGSANVDNLTNEATIYQTLYNTLARTTTGTYSFTSSSSGVTYSTNDYPDNVNIYNKGQSGMISLLDTYVLADYKISVTEWNAINTTITNHLADTDGHSATADATPERIALRDASGRMKVVAGVASTDVANISNITKTAVGLGNVTNDAQATLTNFNAHTGNTTDAHGAVSTATASKIIIRDGAGRAKVVAGSASDDIANVSNITKTAVGLANVTNDAQMPIAGGTFTGAAKAQSNTNYGTEQLRSVIISTSDASGAAANGTVWVKYTN